MSQTSRFRHHCAALERLVEMGLSPQAGCPDQIVNERSPKQQVTASRQDSHVALRSYTVIHSWLAVPDLEAAKVAVRHLDSWLVSEVGRVQVEQFSSQLLRQDGRSEMAVAEAEATSTGEAILHARTSR